MQFLIIDLTYTFFIFASILFLHFKIKFVIHLKQEQIEINPKIPLISETLFYFPWLTLDGFRPRYPYFHNKPNEASS